MMCKKLILIASQLLLVACATTQGFEHWLSLWVGQPISGYIARNNYTPVQVIPGQNGDEIYMFQFSNTAYYTMPTTTNAQASVIGNTVYGTATTTGGNTIPINMQCNWSIVTNSEGIIQTFSWRGNACKMKPIK